MSPGVRDALTRLGLSFTAHTHAPIVSYRDGATLWGAEPERCVKSLAFALGDGLYAVIALRGADRADYAKIAKALGVRRAGLRLADADEIASALDMVPGGVAPLPVGNSIVLVDSAVLEHDLVLIGSGRADCTLELSASELVRTSHAVVADLRRAVP
jgi:Cys-tRNA(Pro)/Cys-tRNA(Cys) deacylase